MKSKTVKLIILITTILILLFDIWLFFDGVEQNTISQIMYSWSQDLLIVPFLWGFLMGHWFA